MRESVITPSGGPVATKLSMQDLGRHGLEPRERVHWNTAPAELIELALRRGEGLLTRDGAFAANTSPHTGRSPNDKFVVRERESEAHIWWGPVNVPLETGAWTRLRDAVVDYLGSQELFVRDVHAGSDSVSRRVAGRRFAAGPRALARATP